ncbi:helix-turn-helix domain-containing protein [Paraburkholderia steynii]|nr:helix-turn-helix domain-containing protein [Paraburkholderia steynii]
MSEHECPPGEDPEIVCLLRWSIREFENGKRYFVGFSRETRDNRVSREIVHLDVAARIGRTVSGGVYYLVGPSGGSSYTEHEFNRVAEVIGEGGAWRDVTAEFISDCHVAGPDNPNELSLEVAASMLFVSRAYVRRLIDDGRLPACTGENGIPTDIPIGGSSAPSRDAYQAKGSSRSSDG